jgi:4-amino-4-deoxy-L-arabinose transferase-like glycosyltransferase
VLLATARYGAGLTTDSVAYLDVASNLMSGKGLISHTGEPMVWWPPLYPALLALIGSVTGLAPSSFAHVVNAVLSGFLVFLAAYLLRTGLRLNTGFAILGVCAMVFSVPLSGIYAMTWSECLFIPLVVLFLVCAQRYRESRSVLMLVMMAVSAALACLTRYIGVVLIPTGILVVVLAPGMARRIRSIQASVFAVASLLPLGFWLLRNYQQAGTLSGNRFHPVFELMTNTILLVTSVLSWYEPFGLAVRSASGASAQVARSASQSVNLFVALVGVCAFAAALALSRAARTRLARGFRSVLRHYQPAVIFVATYSAVLVLLAARGASSFVDQRLLSPLFVPATLVLLQLANGVLGQERAGRTALSRNLPSVLLSLWLCFPLTWVLRSTARRYENGAGGYNTRTWRESETIAQARRLPSTSGGNHLYSNGQDVLWALARVDAGWVPSRTEVALSDLRGRWPEDSMSMIVWFDSIAWRKHLFSVEELGEISDIERVAQLNDGSIYRVSPREALLPNFTLPR